MFIKATASHNLCAILLYHTKGTYSRISSKTSTFSSTEKISSQYFNFYSPIGHTVPFAPTADAQRLSRLRRTHSVFSRLRRTHSVFSRLRRTHGVFPRLRRTHGVFPRLRRSLRKRAARNLLSAPHWKPYRSTPQKTCLSLHRENPYRSKTNVS